jgi:hypothetical protein
VFGALHLQTGMQEAKLFNFVSPGTHLRQVLVDCPPPLEPPVPRGDDHHVGLQPLRCPWLLHLQPGMQEAKFLVFHARYKPAAGSGRPRPVPVNRGRFWQALVDLLHEVPGVFQVLHLILEAVAAANSPGSRFLIEFQSSSIFNRANSSIEVKFSAQV